MERGKLLNSSEIAKILELIAKILELLQENKIAAEIARTIGRNRKAVTNLNADTEKENPLVDDER